MTASKQKSDDKLPEKEAQRRFEKTVERMLHTPPKPHKPKDKRDEAVPSKGKVVTKRSQ